MEYNFGDLLKHFEDDPEVFNNLVKEMQRWPKLAGTTKGNSLSRVMSKAFWWILSEQGYFYWLRIDKTLP